MPPSAGVRVEVAEFEEFFMFMRLRLLRTAMRSLDVDAANEVAVSTLHTIWTKNLPAPRDQRELLQLQALAHRILEGNVRNAQRAHARRVRLLDAVAQSTVTSRRSEPDVADRVADGADGDAVSALLARLPEAERTVVQLVIDGFTVAEIAQLLGHRPGTISMRLHRARKRLRTAWEEE